MGRVGIRAKVTILGVSIVLASCAGARVFLSAQSEFDRGLTLFNSGRYEDAASHFKRATEIDPKFARAYLYLGRSYINLKRWPDAVPPLRAAFILSPEESKKEIVGILVDALLGAAGYEFNRGNFRDSIDYLRGVLELDPHSSRARDEMVIALIALGGTLLSEGKTPEAISTYSEALRFSPNNLDAHIGLANAFLSNGDIPGALRAIETAIKLDPNNRKARSLLKGMKER